MVNKGKLYSGAAKSFLFESDMNLGIFKSARFNFKSRKFSRTAYITLIASTHIASISRDERKVELKIELHRKLQEYSKSSLNIILQNNELMEKLKFKISEAYQVDVILIQEITREKGEN